MRNKALFLDRDGTIIKNIPYLNDSSKVEYLEDVFLSLKKYAELGYLLVMVTNQSGISRGLITLPQLEEIHEKISKDFKKHGLKLAGVYYCPHLNEGCDCRKPKPGMLLQASKELGIDLESSIMIGDSERDVEAGKAAGCLKNFMIDSPHFWKHFEI